MTVSASGKTVDVCIIGGGLCGVLAAHRCYHDGLSYCVIERQPDLGGVWASLANQHSHLQAFEAMYRWSDAYPLGPNPLAKVSGPAVLSTLRRFAKESGVYANTQFNSTATLVDFHLDRFHVSTEDKQGSLAVLQSTYLIVTSGILAEQHTLQERGIHNTDSFRGIITYAGRHNDADSVVNTASAKDKAVVILGTGAFACEAMEASLRNGAKHVYLLSRERMRWVLPFSRQFTTTFVTYIPFLPWRWKMAALKAYLSSFYRSAGILHMMPIGDRMDYTGQCNDAFFRMSRKKAVTFILDTPVALDETGVLCKSGTHLPADMIVNASGCKFNARPGFLQKLGLGYDSMHNYAFLGPSGRVGTASDFVYAFVPHGPKQQLDLIFHAITCHRTGLIADLQKTLQPTSIASKEGGSPSKDTWFTTSSWWSTLNAGMKDRNKCYERTMSVGVGPLGRLRLKLSIATQQTVFWLLSGCLAVIEVLTMRILI